MRIQLSVYPQGYTSSVVASLNDRHMIDAIEVRDGVISVPKIDLDRVLKHFASFDGGQGSVTVKR